MKKTLKIVFLVIATFQIAAGQQIQVEDNPPDWGLMMSNLNTTPLNSGVLCNKVVMFASLYDFSKELISFPFYDSS